MLPLESAELSFFASPVALSEPGQPKRAVGSKEDPSCGQELPDSVDGSCFGTKKSDRFSYKLSTGMR